MKRHGRTLKAYYYVKEDDLKTTHAMILTIWCSAKGDSKKTSSCQGGRGEEGWIWQAQRIVEQWKYSAILQWWICIIIHLSKPTEDTAPRGNQGVHFRRGAVTVCQCGSTPGERCAIWWAGRGIWETSVPPCQSCCKPKKASKKHLVSRGTYQKQRFLNPQINNFQFSLYQLLYSCRKKKIY